MRWLAVGLLVGCASAPLPSSVHAQPVPVALTVDDLPVHGPLPAGLTRVDLARHMLQVFRAHGVPQVVGFVNGARVVDAPTEAVLQTWRDAGQPLGNHTFTHPDLNTTDVATYLADVARNEPLLARFEPDATARHLFRYPFLHEGDTPEKRHAVRAWLSEHAYTVAQVSLDMDDWAFTDPLARCLAHHDEGTAKTLRADFVATGVDELRRMRALGLQLEHREVAQVLLLHVGLADAETLDALLTAYEKEGARWVTLQQALADPVYAFDPDQPMKGGTGFLYFVAKARGVTTDPPIYARGLEERLEQICR